ncbi:phage tail protein [Chitinophaga qingshengii]|uniref:Tail fiber protein n=1 Tax=Chitinophaga qingshengii TaxID=1569794 RepID=A0ABR7TVN1_9BACT|nr:tail fiber protein [Chitinophaga qingshengii]MBC9933039.1 tail fiber protein [Chitinophaga qingshengii]
MDPILAMVFAFGGNFAPVGYALCNGALMAISQNQALFALLGTTYGGNGQVTFGLPNLQGRSIIGTGQSTASGVNYFVGNMGGVENVTLTSANLPIHTHRIDLTKLQVSIPASNAAGTSSTPGPTMVPAALPTIGAGPNSLPIKGYSDATPNTTLLPFKGNGELISDPAGSNMPIPIQSPFLAMTYIIATQGIYPSRQ